MTRAAGGKRHQAKGSCVEQLRHLERARENLIDLDLLVEDRRRDLESAIRALREAVRQRDDQARKLDRLISEYAA